RLLRDRVGCEQTRDPRRRLETNNLHRSRRATRGPAFRAMSRARFSRKQSRRDRVRATASIPARWPREPPSTTKAQLRLRAWGKSWDADHNIHGLPRTGVSCARRRFRMILLGRVALLLALTVSTVAAQSAEVPPTPEVFQVFELPLTLTNPTLVKTKHGYMLKC